MTFSILTQRRMSDISSVALQAMYCRWIDHRNATKRLPTSWTPDTCSMTVVADGVHPRLCCVLHRMQRLAISVPHGCSGRTENLRSCSVVLRRPSCNGRPLAVECVGAGGDVPTSGSR